MTSKAEQKAEQLLELARVEEFLVQGNTAQLNNTAFVKELIAWIRFNQAEAKHKGDGLYSAASGNPSLPRWLGCLMLPLVLQPKPENEKCARQLRSSAGVAVYGLGLLYAATTVLGLLSLESAQDPIGDPFFTLMDLLTITIAPLMVITLVAVHGYARPEAKVYSLIALISMALMAGITSSVHFTILSVNRQIAAAGLPSAALLFSFRWPSVAYALDILAWDWFFALAMLCAAPVFKVGQLEKAVRVLIVASGVLRLAGMVGVPLGNMQVRMVGVVGYAVVAPVAFLLLGKVLGGGGRSPSMAPTVQ